MNCSRPVLLDGGMGRELGFRGVEVPDSIWSAWALMVAPDTVREVHADYIAAGADIITTNTYCTLRTHLERADVADRYEELNRLAGQLAVEARDSAGPAGADRRVAGADVRKLPARSGAASRRRANRSIASRPRFWPTTSICSSARRCRNRTKRWPRRGRQHRPANRSGFRAICIPSCPGICAAANRSPRRRRRSMAFR